MQKKKKYQKPKSVPSSLTKWRTGEDIDMLNERKGGLSSESSSYKNHIDGA